MLLTGQVTWYWVSFEFGIMEMIGDFDKTYFRGVLRTEILTAVSKRENEDVHFWQSLDYMFSKAQLLQIDSQ